jgi:hypothetical protein
MDSGSRRSIALVVGTVMVLVGFAWLAGDEDLDGAEDAVGDYAALIAKGDASAANATVDPGGFESIDPALLTDDVLDAASERIEVREVTVGPDPVVDTNGKVDVQVRYRLAGHQHEATLVAQRDDGFLGFGRQWRVITPLTVAMYVGFDRPGVGQARIGPAPVPVDEGPRIGNFLHVYPGTYTITADPSTYFTAKDHTATFAVDSEVALPDDFPVSVTMEYLPNERLHKDAGTPALAMLDACLADSPDVTDDECPYPTKSDATGVRLTGKPAVSLDDFQFTNLRKAGDITNPIRVLVEFPVAYTDDLGKRAERRSLYGIIHIAEDQTLGVDFGTDAVR